MAQAIVDPEQLRKFARNLNQFSNELENRLGLLHAQMHSLGTSWRDQEQEKFAQEFDETMKVLARFVEATKQQIPFLMRKAERVEDYLKQR
jgi:WXG100 family type VII secretion target